MRFEIHVDAHEYWNSLRADIRTARNSLYVQTLSFEGDRVGSRLARELLSSEAADRRVIADDFYTRHRINDKFLYNPPNWFNKDIRRERADTLDMIDKLKKGGVPVELANPSGPLLYNYLHRNHKKIVVVDDRVAYLGGFNFCDHNFEWHDMMIRFEDRGVAKFLKDDFLSTWKGLDIYASGNFTDVDVLSFDGQTNKDAFEPVFSLIDEAKESIVLISPYVTYPFFDKFKQAVHRGVAVSLITPEQNNWKLLKEYSLWECARSGIDVHMYQDRMSHLKAMLIDDRYLVVGSSNFDFLSCRFMQEVIAVISDAATISQFKNKVLIPDLEQSKRFSGKISHVRGRYNQLFLRGVSALSASLAKLSASGR